MTPFGNQWSGANQLWWTGGKVNSTLTLNIPHSLSGKGRLVIHPTSAVDYAKVIASVDQQESQEADLYTTNVLTAAPIFVDGITLDPKQPLKVVIKITGANPSAVKSYMVGIDAIVIEKAK